MANDKTELDTYDPFPINALGVDLGEQDMSHPTRQEIKLDRY